MKIMEEKDPSEMYHDIAFPMVKRVFAKPLSQELSFYSEEEMQLVKSRIFSENRDRKIDSLVNGTEYVEARLEDDPKYKELVHRGVEPMSLPTGQLFYLDYKCDDNNNTTDLSSIISTAEKNETINFSSFVDTSDTK
jgi:hypothetical protein